MTDLIESRVAAESWPDADVSIRAIDIPDDPFAGRRFAGYAAVFGVRSERLVERGRAPFTETIEHGAFTRTLTDRRSRIKMFVQHNESQVVGSTRARNPLSLREDGTGLLAETILPDTTLGRDTATLIREGIVDSMSFRFGTVVDSWNENRTERTLSEVKLVEVSIVTGYPAYPATSATIRALAEAADEDPDELAEAFRALRAPDARLTSVQRDVLVAAINAHTDRAVPTRLSLWQSTLAPKAPVA